MSHDESATLGGTAEGVQSSPILSFPAARFAHPPQWTKFRYLPQAECVFILSFQHSFPLSRTATAHSFFQPVYPLCLTLILANNFFYLVSRPQHRILQQYILGFHFTQPASKVVISFPLVVTISLNAPTHILTFTVFFYFLDMHPVKFIFTLHSRWPECFLCRLVLFLSLRTPSIVKAKEDRKASTHQTSQIPFSGERVLHKNGDAKKMSLATRSPWRHLVATFILLYTRRSTIFLNPDLASSIMLSVLRFCDSTSNVFFFCILVDMSTSHVSRVTVHVARTLHA